MASGWRVTSDAPDQYDFDGGGNPILGHRIAFLTNDGHAGSVFVPQVHYNAAYVRRQVQAQADIADEVGNLASEGTGQ